MKNSQRGIALIIVLIFLEIFAMLSLYAIQSNLWEHKLARKYWDKQRIIQTAEYLLFSLESQFNVNDSSCEIAITSDDTLLHQSIAWWRSTSCTGNFQLFQYYYVIEKLGTDTCAIVSGIKGQGRVASYRRVTLLVMPQENLAARVILQSTLLKPIKTSENCKDAIHTVLLGKQSWRLLV